ncbi:hypothetical protein ACFQH6_04545 [Halobacteriaceae archaeon GCM10025711]
MAAIALVPAVVAYLQLGYHDDLRARDGFTSPAENADRLLHRSLHRSAANVTEYDWSERDAAVETVRDRLEPGLDALRRSRLTHGTVYRVSANRTAASEWAGDHCPGGPGREFGACDAIDGVIVQDRTGQTHVVAAAFDVRVTTDRGTVSFTTVVRAV